MPFIDVTKSFRFAVGGNRVIEYPVGVHAASVEVVEVATKQLKVAKVLKSSDKVLPPISADINGEPLEDVSSHIDFDLLEKTFAQLESAEKLLSFNQPPDSPFEAGNNGTGSAEHTNENASD